MPVFDIVLLFFDLIRKLFINCRIENGIARKLAGGVVEREFQF